MKPQEAKARAVTQVNPIRPRNANSQVANLPKVLKPDIEGEATGESSPRTLPGWLGTARAERLVEEPGSPVRWVEPKAPWECITRVGARESAGCVVAKKRVTSVERRRPAECMLTQDEERSA